MIGRLLSVNGEQRAVFVYQIQSYRHWQRHLRRDGFSYGQFGENFTMDGPIPGFLERTLP